MLPKHLQAVVTADNLDEAVEKALQTLRCTRAEADVEIIQVPSTGLFGLFGRRPARVRVTLHDRMAIARQITSRLLELSGLNADLEQAASGQNIQLHLKADEPSLLIGKQGQTLDALETLVVAMTDRVTTDRTPIQLDADGYRQRRQTFLAELANRMSHKVRRSGKPAATPPLSLRERRFLHDFFKQEPGLESRSKNHDKGRKVIVLQKQGS